MNSSSNKETRQELWGTSHALAQYSVVFAGLQKCTSNLGILAFTWSTVVLLGGFADTLCPQDFYPVTLLLLVEALRFAATLRLSRVVSTFGRSKEHPADAQRSAAGRSTAAGGGGMQAGADHTAVAIGASVCGTPVPTAAQIPTKSSGLGSLYCMSVVLQVCLPCISLSLAVWRLRMPCEYGSTANVAASLVIFFSLCIASALCAFACLVVWLLARRYIRQRTTGHTLWHACFDHLCCRGQSGSVLDIGDFDFLVWGVKQIAHALRRNEEETDLMQEQCYLPLVRYLCADRYGCLVLSIFITSGDAFEQHAAISMLGFWPEVGRAELLAQTWLLELVADRVAQGQIGWAALATMEALARWPGGIDALASPGGNLLDNVVKLLQQPTRQQLAVARLLSTWFDNDAMRQKALHEQPRLCDVLESVLAQPGNMRRNIWAAQALYKLQGSLSPELCSRYLDITPDTVGDAWHFTYIWSNETAIVDHLRGQANLDSVGWDGLFAIGLQMKG